MQVRSCTVYPNRLRIGDGAALNVTLDERAPAGGIIVAISTDFNGTQDTLAQIPFSMTIEQDSDSGSFPLSTQDVNGWADRIIFTATLGGVGKSAQLNIHN